MTCSAELLSLKRHEVVLKLPALLLRSREHEFLLSMGPYRTFRAAYSAPAVTKKDPMYNGDITSFNLTEITDSLKKYSEYPEGYPYGPQYKCTLE